MTPDSGGAVELAFSDDHLQATYFTAGCLPGFNEATGHVGLYFSNNRDLIGTIELMTDLFPIAVDGFFLSAGARG